MLIRPGSTAAATDRERSENASDHLSDRSGVVPIRQEFGGPATEPRAVGCGTPLSSRNDYLKYSPLAWDVTPPIGGRVFPDRSEGYERGDYARTCPSCEAKSIACRCEDD